MLLVLPSPDKTSLVYLLSAFAKKGIKIVFLFLSFFLANGGTVFQSLALLSHSQKGYRFDSEPGPFRVQFGCSPWEV